MKTFCIAFLAVVLVGCSSPRFKYSGGDGSSMKEAIVIEGTRDQQEALAAEQAWIEQQYPGFEKGPQAILSLGGKNYDVVKIKSQMGDKTVYFDVSNFSEK